MQFVAVLPQFYILPLVVLALFLLGLYLYKVPYRKYYEANYEKETRSSYSSYSRSDSWAFMLSTFAFGCAALMAAISVFLFMPYDLKFYNYYSIKGAVTVETNKFTEGTGDLGYAPVIRVEGYEDLIVMDSARIMALDGKEVDLLCTYGWVPYGMDVTYCQIKSIG